MSRTNRILVIVTSSGEYEKAGYRTGLWLGELTHFYDVAEQAGFELTIASIQGGPVPLDPESLAHAILEVFPPDRRQRRAPVGWSRTRRPAHRPEGSSVTRVPGRRSANRNATPSAIAIP
ncbi:hypothetical protein [Streptomyces shaanxiensis]